MHQNEKEAEKLRLAITSNLGRITLEAINKAGGHHVGDLHVNISDEGLVRRAENTYRNASAFCDEAIAVECVRIYLADPLAQKRIITWILNPSVGAGNRFDDEGAYFGEREYVGKICIYGTYSLIRTCVYHVALSRNGNSYCNPITGLPFDIVTIFPVL